MAHFFSDDEINNIIEKNSEKNSIPVGKGNGAIGRRIIHGEDIEHNKPPVYENEDELIAECGVRFRGNNSSFVLTDSQFSCHVLVLGEQGMGKTESIIFPTVKAVRESLRACDLAIILDIKGDYYKKFYDPAMGDIVVGDPRIPGKEKPKTPVWNMFLDLFEDGRYVKGISDDRAENLALQFFVDMIKPDGDNFFPNSAKECFKWILICLMRKYPKMCNNYFLYQQLSSMSPKRMMDLFEGEQDALSAIEAYDLTGQSEMGKGVIGTLRSAVVTKFISTFTQKSDDAYGEFSASHLVKHPGGKVIFVEQDASSLAGDHMFRIFMDQFLGLATVKRTYGNVYFIFDELKSLPKPQNLERALTLGRGQGVKIIAGIQNMNQFVEVNGPELAKTLTSGFVNIISMRTSDSASAEYLVEKLGTRTYEETRWDMNGATKTETVTAPVIEDHVRLSLNPGQGIVKLSKTDPFIFQFSQFSEY